MATELEWQINDDPRIEWRTRLPVRGEPRFFTVVLDWNTYALAWSFSMFVGQGDLAGTPLIQGKFVRAGENLTRHHTDENLPDGALVPVDLSGEGRDPGRYDMGTRVKLVHLTDEEVAGAA